jgi:hypothetical protein
MAAEVTVANAKLFYGVVADLINTTGAVGDVYWATDTNIEFTCKTAGTNGWVVTRIA